MGKYGCPHAGCEERFVSVGDKRRHLKGDHQGEGGSLGSTPTPGDCATERGVS